MRQDRVNAGRRGIAVLLALSTFAVLTVSLYGFAAGWIKPSRASLRSDDNSEQSRQYVLARPFDAAGWLAWTGSAISLSGELPLLAQQVVGASTMLGPVDPQVLRAKALISLRGGDVLDGLERTADVAALFLSERKDAFATLLAYINDPAWPTFIQSRLKRGWPAVDGFLLYSCQSGTPLASLMGFVQQVARHQALADDTIVCIGNKAIAEGRVPAAYWLWLNASTAVPKALANVFNGDFEAPLAGRLFDWRLGAGGEYREGFAVAIRKDDTRGRDNNVLAVRFNGRALHTPIAQQFLALAPGRYVFSYAMREVGLTTPGAVGWAVRCVPSTLTPAVGALQVQMASSGWVAHSQELTIPPGCDGQLLDMTAGNRLQMLQGLQGSVLIDDISMTRQ